MITSRTTRVFCTLAMVTGGAAWADDSEPGRLRPAAVKASGSSATVANETTNGPCLDCPLETIDRGESSGFRYGDEGFRGLNAVIKSPDAWWRFWMRHTGPFPSLPPPPIDFKQWNIVVTILGTQGSACGPSTAITGVHRCGPAALVKIVEDDTPGPCRAISNPFHIVAVPVRCLGFATSVLFNSHAPGEMPGAVAGRVVAAADPDFPDPGLVQPIAGALIRLIREGDEPHMVAETHANREGFYRLHDVPPGSYVAVVSAEGFLPAEVPLRVFAGETTEQHFVLRRAHEPGGGIVGQVRGGPNLEDSVPLPGVRVLLFAGRGPDDAGLIADAETDCDGRFHFFSLEPGEYHVLAEAHGFLPAGADVVLEPAHVSDIRLLLRPE